MAWRKVRVPYPWRHKPGEELIGRYIETEVRQGQYGEYLVHIIATRGKPLTVSGTKLDSLFKTVTGNQSQSSLSRSETVS